MIHLSRDSIPSDVLEEIITLGEGYKTEFKETLPQPISVAKSLCAFANTKGGNLFIGINDKGKPVGINNESREVVRLEESIPLILPEPEITASVVRFKKHELIYVRVKEGSHKPYFVKNGKNTQAYIRAGDVNLPATKKIIKQFVNSKTFSNSGRKKLKKEEKLIFDLFERHQRLSISQIRDSLNFSPRRIRKALTSLSRRGYVVLSENERETYYRSKN